MVLCMCFSKKIHCIQTLVITAFSSLVFSFLSSCTRPQFSHISGVCIVCVKKAVFKGWRDFGLLLFKFFFFWPFLFCSLVSANTRKRILNYRKENQLRLAKHFTFLLWIFMWIENKIYLGCDCVSLSSVFVTVLTN